MAWPWDDIVKPFFQRMWSTQGPMKWPARAAVVCGTGVLLVGAFATAILAIDKFCQRFWSSDPVGHVSISTDAAITKTVDPLVTVDDEKIVLHNRGTSALRVSRIALPDGCKVNGIIDPPSLVAPNSDWLLYTNNLDDLARTALTSGSGRMTGRVNIYFADESGTRYIIGALVDVVIAADGKLKHYIRTVEQSRTDEN